MRLSKFSERFDEDVRQLAKALARLEEGQGRVARNNARGDVRRVLERVRVRMDAAFPVVPKAPKVRSYGNQALRASRRAATLQRGGWRAVTDGSPSGPLALLAEVGVRVKRAGPGSVFAPQWALLAARQGRTKLAECKRSIVARKALLAGHALGAGATP